MANKYTLQLSPITTTFYTIQDIQLNNYLKNLLGNLEYLIITFFCKFKLTNSDQIKYLR